jgi:hypothetical protein
MQINGKIGTPIDQSLATQGQSHSLAAQGQTGPYTVSGLPAGLAMDADGNLSGSPTTPGSGQITVTPKTGPQAQHNFSVA